MGHDQDIVKQLQRRLKDWNPNKGCRIHSWAFTVKCCEYSGGRLWQLHLCNIGLEQLPPEIWQFPSLKYLHLSTNLLQTLPAELGKFAVLKELDLSNNRLSTLPTELGDLSTLEKLDLSNNRLSTLPIELENLSALTELSLDGNRFQPHPDFARSGYASLVDHEKLRSYLHSLPKQSSDQPVVRQSLMSENVLVSPQIPDMAREQGISNTKETVPLKIFYCYAHEDKGLRDRIDKHLGTLKRLGHVIGWYDREIRAGTEWEREIETHLSTASIILLLVSADFVYSDYCYGVEMQKALEMHEKGKARVLPILLRPVDWQDAPFAKLQMLPTGAKPITSWSDPEAALEDVAKQIRTVVSTLRLRQS